MSKLNVSIQTERLLIESFKKDLITDKYVSWLNDPLVVKHSRQRHREHVLDDCQHYFNSFKDSNNLFFSIREKNNNHIGNITVTIDVANNVSDIAILIGERSVWGIGYGYEAWAAACKYLLDTLKIRKVTGGCYASNTPMQKIMKKTGMIFDGSRKRHIIVDGSPVDIVHYALFNDK